MKFFKTVDDIDFIRIEEDSGAAITLNLQEYEADIAALFVDKDDRRQGMGLGLLEAAEKEAALREVRALDAGFLDGIAGMRDGLTTSRTSKSTISPRS